MHISWFRVVSINLAAALLYLTFGWVSTGLTTSPEYFTPVWIPTGICTLFVLLWGSKSYPGIILGSIAFHFYFYHGSIPEENLLRWTWQNFNYVPGILLQCWFAQKIFRKFTKDPLFQPGVRTLIKMLFLSAVLALIIPVWTNIILIFEIPELTLMQWFSSLGRWWFGDFLGIICLIPLTVFLVQVSQGETTGRIIRYASPTIIFLVCLVIGYRVIADHEVTSVRDHFERELKTTEERLLEEFQDIMNEIELLRIQFQQDGHIDREKFGQQAFRIYETHRSIQAVSWIPFILEQDIPQFENELIEHQPDSNGFTHRRGNQLYPLPNPLPNPFIFPITIPVPYTSNETVYGMDLSVFSEHAMREALQSGSPLIPSAFRLAQEKGNQKGIAVYYPTQKADWDSLTDSFESGTIGFFNIPIRMDDYVFGRWIPTTFIGLDLQITDVTDRHNPTLLSRILNGKIQEGSKNPDDKMNAVFSKSIEISVLNRTWEIKLEADRTYFSFYHSASPFILLSIGLSACFLLGNYTLGNYLRTSLIEKTVEIQTRELRLAKDEAEQLASAKSEFLAVMSHEIRTPMNGMISTAEMLKDGPLTEEQSELAGIIEMSANTLLALINDILDFSKLEAGKTHLQESPFDPYEVARVVEATFRSKVKEKGISLRMETNIDTTSCPTLLGDEARLVQIVMNLVSNAVKFTDKGEIVLRTEIHQTDNDFAELIYEISDTGIGISPEKQRELFEPFTQADISSTRKYGGTGLGLAIIKRLLDLLDGSVNLKSEPGKGSTFTVRIRLKCAGDCGIETDPVADESIEQNSQRAKHSVKVLLVEDNLQNQRIMNLLLGKLKISFETVSDGESAVEIAGQKKFDLIFMDCRLPKMDGYEASLRIREKEAAEKRSPTPIVALTATNFEGAKDECLKAGMDDFISKPVTKKSIETAIEKWCQP